MSSKKTKETIDTISNQITMDIYKTNLKKEAFAREMKSGLGELIKENPNAVIFTKEETEKAERERRDNLSIFAKIKESIIKFFTKF